MRSTITKNLLLMLAVVLVNGCATVFKGYEDEVSLIQMPHDTKVYTLGNIEIPILYETQKIKWVISGHEEHDSIQIVRSYILLRSNTDHILYFKNHDQEKRVHVYPRLSAGWFILDCITGTFFVDLYTGNWNHFQEIDFADDKQ